MASKRPHHPKHNITLRTCEEHKAGDTVRQNGHLYLVTSCTAHLDMPEKYTYDLVPKGGKG